MTTTTTSIFVNFPVKDLDRSVAFFKAIDFEFNPNFTDKTAACMVVTNNINLMLLTHAKFKDFTKKTIADTRNIIEVLTCLSFDSRARVNEIVDKAIAAGGTETGAPEDQGFMFQRSFDDPDGHTWEIIWMDPGFEKNGAK